jgi:hypothetical protein
LRKRSQAGTGPENKIFQNTTSKKEVKKLLVTEKLQQVCKKGSQPLVIRSE